MPTECYLVVTRNDCFCPEKAVHFSLSERGAEAAVKIFEKQGIKTSIVKCTIMSEETFFELCPDWKH